MSIEMTAILAGTIAAATPLIFAGLGELVVQRTGVINLGVEGMMLIGAIAGFAFSATFELSVMASLLVGGVAGMLMALIFAFFTLSLSTNQSASGLALTIFGIGVSAFVGQHYVSMALPGLNGLNIPLLADIPYIGAIFFQQNYVVYLSVLAFLLVWYVLHKTRLGLLLKAVGESPESAHAMGYNVLAIRYCAILFGGAMVGIGGAFLSTVYTPMWIENMVAGRGWIAIALVVFAVWKPTRLMLGAYLFGGVTILQFHAQALGLNVPNELLSALPYLATIFVLVLISRDKKLLKMNLPASLGKTFSP
jgi:general nucleoside transport system permease protein